MITFEDFFTVPVWFYRHLGNSAEPFGPPFERAWQRFVYKKIYYTLLIFYFFCMLSTGLTVFRNCSKGNILEILDSSCCFFFCINGLLKEGVFHQQLQPMITLVEELKEMFPKTKELQEEMKVAQYHKKIQKLFLSLVVFANGFIWWWNIIPVFKSIKDYLLYGGKYRKELCYYIYYPWYDEDGSFISYVFSYLCDMCAGIFAGVTFANIDLIQCAIIMQICMYLDYISKNMEEFVPVGDYERDCEFVFPHIQLHSKCLTLSQTVNNTFQICLLVNFILSSLAICFLLFQISLSGLQMLPRYGPLFAANLVQVWILCYYGNLLSDSSSYVSQACYNQQWYSGDTKYRRLLLIMMMRSQKPATIKPPTFRPTSRELFKEILSMSYRFFCVLNTSLKEKV